MSWRQPRARATLARARRPATGRLNSGVRRQKSFLQMCRSQALFTGFGRLFFSDRLSARCHFAQVYGARSHITCVAFIGFGIFVFFREASGLHMLSFLTGPAESLRGALMLSRFGFRQVCQRLQLHRHPTRLTIRSSRPRVVASATCDALRLHVSATPPRGGLTQALGTTNEH